MKKISISVLFILVSVTFALAQTSTGRLTGAVSSADGVLPGASVTVTDNATGKEQTLTTNESGNFTFPQLESGTYTVRITASGFKTFVANEVKIDIGREYSLNPALEVGAIQETVTVTAGADVVTATTAQVSNTVSPQQILSLPLLAREPLGLTQLQAGVQSGVGAATTVNGMRTSFTNITRDGINVQDNFIRSNATDFSPNRPTVDDTAEFTVITNNQEADQGYGGAQVRLVTPRGTKDFHGALFAYNRNSEFGANSFFNNRSGSPRGFRNRNQFGGKVGGPLPIPNFGEGGSVFHKDKGFFFFSYEKVLDPNSVSATRTILTPGARTGQFQYNRATLGPAINQQVGTATVTCPARVAATDPAVVCTVSDILGFARGSGLANIPSTIDPIIQARIISRLPTTSNFTGGDNLNTAGYRFTRSTDLNRSNYAGRIDVDLDDKNSISGVYTFTAETALRTDFDPTFTITPEGNVVVDGKLLALSYRRIIGSNIVNEIRGGLFNTNTQFNVLGAQQSNFLDVPLVSNPENTSIPQGRSVKTYNLQDNVDWVIGKHSVRFGGQLQYFQPTSTSAFGIVPTISVGTSTNSTPFFATTNFPGGISTAQVGTANGLLGLLGGIVNGVQQTFYVNDINSNQYSAGAARIQPFRYENHSLFVSDRWQVTNNLTLSLGIRYELFPALRQVNGVGLEPVLDADDPVASLLDPNGRLQLIGGNAGRENAFYKTDYNNFAPSVGFAYSPKFESGFGKLLLDRTVIRGGYSRVFGNDQIVTAINQAAANNTGLGSVTTFGLNATGTSNFLNLRLGAGGIPDAPVPTRVPISELTFLRNTTPPIANFAGVVFGVDPKIQTPMVEQYSFGLQREFGSNMAVEVRYVGTRSNNITRAFNVNEIDVVNNGFLADYQRAAANLALTGNAFCTTAGCQTLQIFQNGGTGAPGRIAIPSTYLATFNSFLRDGQVANLGNSIINNGLNNQPIVSNPNRQPFVNFLTNPSAGTTVALLTNEGYYNYNSLQVEFRRRFAQGLYLQANYTFSKNLTNSITTGQLQFEPFLQNNNPELDNQRADFDLTHVFNFNGVYQLPFGKGKTFLNQGGIVDKIFGGWEISGIVQAFSGLPITIVDPRGTLNTSGRAGRQTAQSSLTNQQIRSLAGVFEQNGRIYFIDPSILNSNGQASAGFGTTAFPGQVFFNNGAGQTGNVARTIFNGPGYFNVNAALLKNISFTESIRVQLRAEAFNLFNNVNFVQNAQLQNISASTFGQITGTTDPRIMQFAIRFEF